MDIFQIDSEFEALAKDADNDDLLALLEAHRDLEDDAGIETFIYLCMHAFRRDPDALHHEHAIKSAIEWLESTPPAHPDRSRRCQLVDCVVAINAQYEEINSASTQSRIREQRPNFGEDMAESLASSLYANYEHTRNIDNLHQAINVMESSLRSLVPPPKQLDRVQMLSSFLITRFQRLNDFADLDRAIELSEQASRMAASQRSDQSRILRELGWLLALRATKRGTGELGRAIQVVQSALVHTPNGDSESKYAAMNILASLLRQQYHREGRIEDLNLAVEYREQCLRNIPAGYPAHLKALSFSEYAIDLGERYIYGNHLSDLHQAIGLCERALPLANGLVKSSVQRQLAKWLGVRFLRLNDPEDLNKSLIYAQAAVSSLPPDHPDRSDCLDTLGNKYGDRYEHLGGDLEDLNKAIDLIQEAVHLSPQGEPNRLMKLSNLATWLGVRFERTGDLSTLNSAIEAAHEAAKSNLLPLQRVTRLGILSAWLCTRFHLTGDQADLDRAIKVARKAISFLPPGHTEQTGRFIDLGTFMLLRFKRTGSLDDIKEAVKMHEEALAQAPPDHTEWPLYANNLAISLEQLHEAEPGPGLQHLDRAVELRHAAIDKLPETHANRYALMMNVGNSLREKYELTNDVNHLIRSIAILRKALRETPQEHAQRGALFAKLGLSFEARKPAAEEEIDEALAAYESSFSCSSSPTGIRIVAARAAARIHASRGSWEAASRLTTQAVELLPRLNSRMLPTADKQHQLQDMAGLASEAAAVALNAGKTPFEALRLLELGRNTVANAMLGIHADTSELERRLPTLAAEFQAASKALAASSVRNTQDLDDAMTSIPQSKKASDAEATFEQVVGAIRAQPGFRTFLDAPSLEECIHAANDGFIVVLNMHLHRCDAFVITKDGIQVVELGNLMDTMIKHFGSTDRFLIPIDWTWSNIALPILQALGVRNPPLDDEWPRVWWIIVSPFARFPIHLAGCYNGIGFEGVLDRVMSSYSLSVTSLIHARMKQNDQSTKTASTKQNALLLSLSATPGYSDLPSAPKEISEVQTLCKSLDHHPTLLPEHRCAVPETLAALRSCNIFHYAGHGHVNEIDPPQSGLILKDRTLTIADLSNISAHDSKPFLAYLSACSTGHVGNTRSTDESIHLIAAFHLTGFRHVVGTLWEVSDSHCVEIAREFYKTLALQMKSSGELTDRSVCLGLHKATRALRDRNIAKEIDRDGGDDRDDRDGKMKRKRKVVKAALSVEWMPYVHYGP